MTLILDLQTNQPIHIPLGCLVFRGPRYNSRVHAKLRTRPNAKFGSSMVEDAFKTSAQSLCYSPISSLVNKIGMVHLITLLGHDLCREDPMLNGNGTKENDQFCSPRGVHAGGGFFASDPDVQSMWSFNEKETT
ncbi:hypothetical protein PR202_ga24974 [Eleusine coracana subsp. coracana]|uniref:Uncharacterized protein n=1 Tax=Eleusine coracana subsp. coracana TaxID=191504 RepID=A0AAV5D866_ELECO|nr:hypothetical protein PR202_ga24974 [Eleusine coracana subsp. coracana]